MADWVGNASFRNCNVRSQNAEPNDYYATEPRATELLLELEEFNHHIWEPACGEGHISKVLEAHGYDVFSSDLIHRGYGTPYFDFLDWKHMDGDDDFDIITNPPYKYAREFVEKALEVVGEGHKVAMFLKLTFLEGKARRNLFRENPPLRVYVASARLQCGKNGVFEGSSMAAYAWFIWQKGHQGPCELRWFN